MQIYCATEEKPHHAQSQLKGRCYQQLHQDDLHVSDWQCAPYALKSAGKPVSVTYVYAEHSTFRCAIDWYQSTILVNKNHTHATVKRDAMTSQNLSILIASMLLVGCTQTYDAPPVRNVPAVATPQPQQVGQKQPIQRTQPTHQAPPSKNRLQGKVVQTMDASGYTYIAVSQPAGDVIWAAGPQTAVEVGRQVNLPSGLEMTNFESKTLGRTFDRIFFLKSFGAATQGSAPAPSSPHAFTPKPANPYATPKTNAGTAPKGSTPSANHIHTVAQLFAQAANLNKNTIKVRGKVVKFSPNIMGTNWLHIQDGTGSAANKTNDLVVTSKQSAATGDQVVVTGILTTNKDFGAGYRYEVIVENAQLAPQ